MTVENERIPFGKPMLAAFGMDSEYTNLNSRQSMLQTFAPLSQLTISLIASAGTWPKAVSRQLKAYWSQLEAQPDLFSEFGQGSILQEARLGLARLLQADVSECVLVTNATTGIFTVLYNQEFREGDVVLTLSTTYGAIEHALTSLAETRPLQIRKVEFELPCTGASIVSQFSDAVAKIKAEGLNPRLAVIETLVSIPAVRMPFEELVHVCRREGVMSLVDGAHSVGQFEINLQELQPDYFVADCHKWLFVPRPCAVLYVPKRNQRMIRSTIPTSFAFITKDRPAQLPLWSQMVSSTPGASSFETLFAYTATSDNMPHMCIPTALRFRQDVCGGEAAIYQYMKQLAKRGGDRVAEILQTEVLEEPGLGPGVESQMRNCSIVTVRLPLAIAPKASTASSNMLGTALTEEELGPAVQFLTKALAETYKTWLPIIDYGGWVWVRLCAQIYLEVSDFEMAANALKAICGMILERKTGRGTADTLTVSFE